MSGDADDVDADGADDNVGDNDGVCFSLALAQANGATARGKSTVGSTGVPTCLSRGGASDGRFSSASPPASGIRCAASSPQLFAPTTWLFAKNARESRTPALCTHVPRSPEAEPPSRFAPTTWLCKKMRPTTLCTHVPRSPEADGKNETFLSGPQARPVGAENLRPQFIQDPAG